jgi:hypothetical protein
MEYAMCHGSLLLFCQFGDLRENYLIGYRKEIWEKESSLVSCWSDSH